MILEKFDVAIIGGGILGTALSYWLSSLFDAKICVLEKENRVAAHASGRNTGVVHSPFYIDPQKRGKIAKAALLSYDLWKEFALQYDIPWKACGTIEVALDEKQHKSLEKYIVWGKQNGIPDEQMELLDSAGVMKKEPNIRCHSGLHCSRDASTNYGMLTSKLYNISESNGTKFIFNFAVTDIDNTQDGDILIRSANSSIRCKFLINCAGGRSLEIAKRLELGMEYSALHFRGEYWVAEPECANMVNTNIYSVAKFANFPFLDPHWIKKANGQTEIGPNAVPVIGPETYTGFVGNDSDLFTAIKDAFAGNSRKLLTNPEFLALISSEWKSSLSKNAMVDRVRQFIPAIKPSFFKRRGISGIRSPIITKTGQFLSDILEIEGPNSFHIVNYNSPGATGAPAYTAFIVNKLRKNGYLNYNKKDSRFIWNYEKIIEC
jgi:L-2-hydroxyglutarate oxidase